MSIDVTSTAMSTAAAPVANNKVNSSGADKTSADSSFKDEMTKVDSKENKIEAKQENNAKTEEPKTEKTTAKSNDTSQKSENKQNNENAANNIQNISQNNVLNGNIAVNNPDALTNANNMLQNDIAQMIENTTSINSAQNSIWSFNLGGNTTNSLAMNENDAQFFINLTQSNDVSARNMMTQAQNMLNSGIDTKQVAQNFKVSQTLLNALSEARQNNQPLRIDFDQNISVILRVGKDGAIAANFIPGDKAVEQYLKSNIESLKASFEEQDLPYSELSYSNSSKEQNQRRRNKQQGE